MGLEAHGTKYWTCSGFHSHMFLTPQIEINRT